MLNQREMVERKMAKEILKSEKGVHDCQPQGEFIHKRSDYIRRLMLMQLDAEIDIHARGEGNWKLGECRVDESEFNQRYIFSKLITDRWRTNFADT